MGGSISAPCRGTDDAILPELLSEMDRLQDLKAELALKEEELQLKEEELQLREERLHSDIEVSHRLKAQLSKAPSLAIEPAEYNEDFAANATEKQVQSMPEKARGLYSSDNSEVLKAARVYRDLVTDHVEDNLDIILNDGVGTKLVSFLEEGHSGELQREVMSILQAISSPAANFSDYLRSVGSTAPLIALIASSDSALSESAMMTLGNMALAGPQQRDSVLNSGLLDRLMLLPAEKKHSYPAVWLASAICGEQVNADVATEVLPLLTDPGVLENEDTAAEACWALSGLTNPDNTEVCFSGELLRLGTLRIILYLVRNSNQEVAISALRTVCNVAAAGEWEMDELLEMGMLEAVLHALRHTENSAVRRRSALVLQQVVEGEVRHLQAFVDNVTLSRVLVACVKDKSLATSARHSCATVLMTATRGATDQIASLIPGGIVAAVWEVLHFENSQMQGLGLEALQNILLAGEEEAAEGELSYNPYCKILDSLGVFNALETLTTSPEHSELVMDIKDTFVEDWFGSKDEVLGEVLPDLNTTSVLWAILKVQAVLRGKLARIRIKETKQMQAEDDLNRMLLGEAASLETVREGEEPAEVGTPSKVMGSQDSERVLKTDTPSRRKGQLQPIGPPMSLDSGAKLPSILPATASSPRVAPKDDDISSIGDTGAKLPSILPATTSSPRNALKDDSISAFGDSKQEHAAAAKLQAIQRGRSARKEVQALRYQQQGTTAEPVDANNQEGNEEAGQSDFSGWADSEEMNAAAAKLQAVQRGRSARKQVRELRTLPSHSEELKEMQELKAAQLKSMEDTQAGQQLAENGDVSAIGDSEEEQAAATKLQAIQRGRQARKQMEEMKTTPATPEAPAAE